MPKLEVQTRRIEVRLSERMDAGLRAEARHRSRSVSDLVREAIHAVFFAPKSGTIGSAVGTEGITTQEPAA